MSHTKSSCTTSNDKNHCVSKRSKDGSDASAEKDSVLGNNNSSSPDSSVRERVLKEVGLTSSTFIGPAFPPPKKKKKVKSDIEDTLSEFYKELEQIDTPDGANENQEKQDGGFVQPSLPLTRSYNRDTYDVRGEYPVNTGYSADTDGYQRSGGQAHPPWPHWYENEPYLPRRPRPGLDQSSARSSSPQNQRHYPQPQSRPPNPGFHRPPFRPPPPPHAFPSQQNSPSHVTKNWTSSGFTNQRQDDSHFPPIPNFPPPNVSNQPPQDFHRNSPHHFDRDERVSSYGVHSEKVDFGWSTDRKEQWCEFSEDYDWRHRKDSESEQWERHHPHPDKTNAHSSSLVLILMRGLPGSGKSTRARELLSTGPSGLILSTDDYFSLREGYRYEAGLLGAAHEWNQRRAEDAMRDGRSPIIIDNTNIQAWEMKPYVKMAMERGYRVDFCEPDTSWKFDPSELERRNKHGVPQEKIAHMMDRFSFPISVDIVMSSQEPHHVNQRHPPERAPMMWKH
ncbi:NEDD4-binding protein 2-like 2 [Notolabrus celidotus]|uniref:NEDD4-binding protein 2-like 2 n=1 Tax=Notolabrus celidotus TaxID=1203425 RepID=UPI00148F6C4C|nr:NEDD4-binding protein 2-like 2 [Notolabrus celidotus]